MPDEIDLAQEREHIATHSAVNDVRAKAAAIEPGTPGDCDLCGEWSADQTLPLWINLSLICAQNPTTETYRPGCCAARARSRAASPRIKRGKSIR